jgi:hypothetical protein
VTRRRLVPLAVILIVAGLLTLVLQDYARQLIRPLLFVAWIGRLLVETIPQVFIWGIFVGIALLVAARSLFKRSVTGPPVRRSQPPAEGRIERWATLIEQSGQETYYRWQLAQPLQALIIDMLAHQQRSTPRQIKQQLAADSIDLPPEIQAYLQASMTSFSRLLTDLSRFRPRPTPSPLDLAPEKIAQFLEDQLDYHPD